ncbi:MAG: hypothetical protein HQ538_04550 [Parcubacteria group bacterium]|nr:hypothetical protein [Parcubacteria group bacterium]
MAEETEKMEKEKCLGCDEEMMDDDGLHIKVLCRTVKDNVFLSPFLPDEGKVHNAKCAGNAVRKGLVLKLGDLVTEGKMTAEDAAKLIC